MDPMSAHDSTDPHPFADGDAPLDGTMDAAEQPVVDAVPEGPDELDAVVSRRVNLRTFILLGAVVGAVLAFILTYAFPEHPEFTRGQVLGFLLVFVTAFTALAFAGIGLIVDAVVSRRRGTATIRRVPD